MTIDEAEKILGLIEQMKRWRDRAQKAELEVDELLAAYNRRNQEADNAFDALQELLVSSKAHHYQMALGPYASYPKAITDTLAKLEAAIAKAEGRPE